MSHDTCDVVKIKADNEQGYVVINASAFNADKGHEAYDPDRPDSVEVLGVNLSLTVEDDLTGIKVPVTRRFKKSTEGA